MPSRQNFPESGPLSGHKLVTAIWVSDLYLGVLVLIVLSDREAVMLVVIRLCNILVEGLNPADSIFTYLIFFLCSPQ